MNLYEKVKSKEEKISVIGLGYVGLPLAVAFAEKCHVIGYDISEKKIDLYNKGVDVTKEVGDDILRASTVVMTCDERLLKDSKFHIVAVPTPICNDKTPNLKPVMEACKTVGRNLVKGSIIVFESTVYPGVTEEICVPILEETSGLACGIDFKVGYSPERINPGDKVHRLEKIVKVVSGMDEEALAIISDVYELIIEAGVYKAESIKVAEAAKVIENSQRDINIAFMNELSMIFNQLGIDTQQVLRAAGTKWNFLNFYPGLVGGHCIGVDPYYLTYKAGEIGYHSQVILSGRKINDEMGKYVAEQTVKLMIKEDKHIKGSTVAILGVTFKENCPDVRNTKVIDVINHLQEYDVEVKVVDPVADQEDLYRAYGLKTYDMEEINNVDAVILAVKHQVFEDFSFENLKKYYADDKRILVDVKGMFSRSEAAQLDYTYWRL